MRTMSVLLCAGFGAAALLALAWWYALAVPGRTHTGPLPPAAREEKDLVIRLKQHVVATASVPHNVKHYAALEHAAQHIESSLKALGYVVNRHTFTVAGRPVRNIEERRINAP